MRPLNEYVVSKATLDRWEVKRSTISTVPHLVFEVTVTGWCNRRRRPLFVHSEVVAPSNEPMKVSDVAHHYALVCEQDRPTTQEAFDRGLLGQYFDQPELPWT